jgi:hypothetical protein
VNKWDILTQLQHIATKKQSVLKMSVRQCLIMPDGLTFEAPDSKVDIEDPPRQ